MAEFVSDKGYSEFSDLSLAEKVRRGDNEAFGVLSNRYGGLIRSIAERYSAAGLDRNDFSQEGLLGLLWACKAFDSEKNASFKNFASICINRRFLSLVRKDMSKKAIPKEKLLSIEDLEISDENTLNPEILMLQKEQAEDFDKLLKSRLSPLEQKVLRLYLSGMTYSDISKKLSVSLKSVDNALQRIRKKLT
ncbi:MAG: sigma-70 family RNA polymerase sigma factor [Ruminococcus sp.]|nr:sigma-70 family RNA polymerase sigma factor [Oscillospiraceae bacterium]